MTFRVNSLQSLAKEKGTRKEPRNRRQTSWTSSQVTYLFRAGELFYRQKPYLLKLQKVLRTISPLPALFSRQRRGIYRMERNGTVNKSRTAAFLHGFRLGPFNLPATQHTASPAP